MLARLVMVAALSLGACAKKTPSGRAHPNTALDRYIEYVRANDPRAAYKLLSKKVRTVLSYDVFARKWKRSYRELKAQAEEMRKDRSVDKRYKVRADIKLGDKRRAALSLEGRKWKILGGVGAGFDALTPKEAVLALIRAVETRNFRAFIKLLSKGQREKLLRELRSRLEKLKANVDREFEITGNRARLQYDPKRWLRLVKENGVWKVLDFN